MDIRGLQQQQQQQQERRMKAQAQEQQQQQPQKCPRCDSLNTKFCYYNNYSLSQPRYFCKACRRYWTQGGTLRNVPVGGGSRKEKRSRTRPPSSSSSSSLQENESIIPNTTATIPIISMKESDAITVSTTTTSSAEYYSGSGFFSSLVGGMNSSELRGFQTPLNTSFNHPLLHGFSLPVPQQLQQQQQDFHVGMDRHLNQQLLPNDIGHPSHQQLQHGLENTQPSGASDTGYWNSSSSGAGTSTSSSSSHWQSAPFL